jgi:hypothetical protein
MSYSAILKKCVKSHYGNWLLVQLPSGSWKDAWWAIMGVEEMCETVVTGSPRFDGDGLAVSHSSRGDALQMIVVSIERDIRNEQVGHNAETLKPFLKKARLALLRERAKEQKLD